MTHICVDNLTIIGSDNVLSPGRRQAIIWTSVGILLIEPLGTNFSEILIEIIAFSVKKMHLKMSGYWRPFCLGLNELIVIFISDRGSSSWPVALKSVTNYSGQKVGPRSSQLKWNDVIVPWWTVDSIVILTLAPNYCEKIQNGWISDKVFCPL